MYELCILNYNLNLMDIKMAERKKKLHNKKNYKNKQNKK